MLSEEDLTNYKINEKSGPSQEPDHYLLTLMKKQFDELKVNFDKLTESLPEKPSKKKGPGKEFERLVSDTHQKAGKR